MTRADLLRSFCSFDIPRPVPSLTTKIDTDYFGNDRSSPPRERTTDSEETRRKEAVDRRRCVWSSWTSRSSRRRERCVVPNLIVCKNNVREYYMELENVVDSLSSFLSFRRWLKSTGS